MGSGGRNDFFQGEAEGRGVQGALSGPFVAVDGKSDIVCGVLVFVLRGVRRSFLAEQDVVPGAGKMGRK